jgi:tRNA-2-methylthio-N6-dimethylallyladenosine synthase
MTTTAHKTVYLETIGCQMNALDSELVLGDLMALGYVPTDDMMAASLVVLNTCSVRQHAEDKVYSRIGQLNAGRHRHPGRILAVIGCMAERDSDGLLARMPRVDILCGPSLLHRLPGLIADVEAGRAPARALSGHRRDEASTVRQVGGHDDLESLDSSRASGVTRHVVVPKVFGPRQAYVRITRGCNKFCSFCVVPYTRGPEEHRSPERIIEEVRRLVDGGVVEVTLLGQTVNHYRYREDGTGRETSFAELLRRLHEEIPQLPRLRFVTSYPRDFTDDILQVMVSCRRICRYLHLPAQSGSDAVLRRMNRGYTVEGYKAIVERARGLMGDISIAGDMIVGFSGETEEDFQQSLDLLRFARYKNCFVFKYSPRPGTKAAEHLADDVPDGIKRRRNKAMLAVQAEINLADRQGMLGQTVGILVEGLSKTAMKAHGAVRRRECNRGSSGRPALGEAATEAPAGQGACSSEVNPSAASPLQLVGRTEGDQIVVVEGAPDLVGQFAQVRITGATPYTLFGERVGPG